MTGKEENARKIFFENQKFIYPTIALFFSYLVFPDNEWLGLFFILLLVPVFLVYRFDGIGLVKYGIAVMAIGAFSNSNGFTVSGFWLVVSGVICLFAELLKSGDHGLGKAKS